MADNNTLISNRPIVRGEVAELREKLKTDLSTRSKVDNEESMLSDVKNVVKFMTAGVDVSNLFPEMVMACNTRNVIQKKLVYLYLTNYAEVNKDSSILCVNTIQKDCSDTSPQIRGMALRALSSLCIRVRILCEYVTPLVQKLIKDPSSYVRKIAVLSAAKVYRATEGKQAVFLSFVRKLCKDHDTQVAMNALASLREMIGKEEMKKLGIVDKDFIIYNLNRMRDLSEWNLIFFLECMLDYEPKEESFVLDILNALDDKLKHTNSGVVIGVISVFLKYTESIGMTGVYQQIFSRVKGPLLLLLSTLPVELTYPLLLHIKLLITRNNTFLENDFSHFFIRGSEPTYIKMIKLDILTEIITVKNAKVIVEELDAYITDVDTEFGEHAVKCFGKVALMIPEIINSIFPIMLHHLELEVEHISAAVIIVLKDLVRFAPELGRSLCPHLTSDLIGTVGSDAKAKAACVWLIGEFGTLTEDSDTSTDQIGQPQTKTGNLLEDFSVNGPPQQSKPISNSEDYLILDAPYLLEDLVICWNEQDFHVKLELLTGLMKLYVGRPSETQAILGKALKNGCGDVDRTEVHDKALFYYRLLQSCSVANALGVLKDVICPSKAPIMKFEDETDIELSDQLFEEFNTLSVVLNKPSDGFLKPVKRYYKAPTNTPSSSGTSTAPVLPLHSILPVQPGSLVVSPPTADLIGIGEGKGETSTNLNMVSSQSTNNASLFKKRPDLLSQQDFLKLWEQLVISDVLQDIYKGDVNGLIEKVKGNTYQYLSPVACGIVGDLAKIYSYGQSTNGVFVLSELLINKSSGDVNGTIKSTETQVAKEYTDLLGDQLFPLPDTSLIGLTSSVPATVPAPVSTVTRTLLDDLL